MKVNKPSHRWGIGWDGMKGEEWSTLRRKKIRNENKAKEEIWKMGVERENCKKNRVRRLDGKIKVEDRNCRNCRRKMRGTKRKRL